MFLAAMKLHSQGYRSSWPDKTNCFHTIRSYSYRLWKIVYVWWINKHNAAPGSEKHANMINTLISRLGYAYLIYYQYSYISQLRLFIYLSILAFLRPLLDEISTIECNWYTSIIYIPNLVSVVNYFIGTYFFN